MRKATFLILSFLFCFLASAAQPPKQSQTLGPYKLNAGTTVVPSFKVPDKAQKVVDVAITCDPTVNYTIVIAESTDNGSTWQSSTIVRQAAPCLTRTGATTTTFGFFSRRVNAAGPFLYVPGTLLQITVTIDKAMSITAVLTFDLSA